MCHVLIHIIMRLDQLGSLTILEALLCSIVMSLEGGMRRKYLEILFFFFFSQNQMVKILPFLPDLLNQNARGGAGCLNFDNILPGTSIYSPGCEPCSKELGYL